MDARPATAQWRLDPSDALHDLGRLPGPGPAESRAYLERARQSLLTLAEAGVLPAHKRATLTRIERRLAELGD